MRLFRSSLITGCRFEIGQDKWATMEFLREHRIPHPLAKENLASAHDLVDARNAAGAKTRASLHTLC